MSAMSAGIFARVIAPQEFALAYRNWGPMVRIHFPPGMSLRTSGPRGPTTPRPITLRSELDPENETVG
jgi:hypothetical protein